MVKEYIFVIFQSSLILSISCLKEKCKHLVRNSMKQMDVCLSGLKKVHLSCVWFECSSKLDIVKFIF